MKKKVKFIIANCCQIDIDDVGNNAAVSITKNWDSFNHLQIMMCIEKEFGVALDTRTIASLTTYQDILTYLKESR